ncbi:MAG: LamG domain-containing protein, partial [Lentisphaerota bacterium]
GVALKGLLDDVKIDGTALSAAQVQAEYLKRDAKPFIQIKDSPSLVHPFGDKCYQVIAKYDCGANANLMLKIAFAEEGDNGDGTPFEQYQTLSAGVLGTGEQLFWVWIPDYSQSDTDYISTTDGGQYVFRAWLEDSAGRVVASAVPMPTELKWGVRPTESVPVMLDKGGSYTIGYEWEDLYEYLPWEVTPLTRNSSFPDRIAIYRSSKTEQFYPGQFEKANQVADWLETEGYEQGNPLDLVFDNVSVNDIVGNGNTLYQPSVNLSFNQTGGTIVTNTGFSQEGFTVSASSEHTLYGVSGSSGGGSTPKCLIYYATGKDASNALVQICSDIPGIFPSVCQAGVTVYVRETTPVMTTGYCASCEAVQEKGLSTGDGVYSIDPDGPGGNAAFNADCLMSMAGGGWTKLTLGVANTVLNTSTNSNREYLFVYDGKWYRTPVSKLVWDWNSGKDVYGAYYYGKWDRMTLVGSATWETGLVDRAISITGNAYIDASSLDLKNAWTIACRFKMPLAVATDWNTLTRGTSLDHQVIVQRSTGLLGSYGNSAAFVSSGFNMNTVSNGWHQLVAVGSSGTTRFYLDGTLVGTAPFQSTSDIKAIGNYQGGGQPWGIIEDLAIFNDKALTSSQVAGLMSGSYTFSSMVFGTTLFTDDFEDGNIDGWRREAGCANWTTNAPERGLRLSRIGNDDNISRVSAMPSLQNFWAFNEGEGPIAHDASYAARHGVLTGGCSWASGHSGFGVSCAGATSYVDVGGVPLSCAWTIACWFQSPLASAADWNTLTRGSAADHHVIVQKSTGLLGTYVGGFYSSGFNMNTLAAGWHHLVASGSGGQTRYYVDGVLAGTAARQSVSDIKAIGNYQSGTQPFGVIDDMAIYQGAVNAAQAGDLYAGQPISEAMAWTNFSVNVDVQYQKQDHYFNNADLYFRYVDRDNFYKVGIRNFYGFWRVMYEIRYTGAVQAVGILHEFSKTNQPMEGVWYNLRADVVGTNADIYFNGNMVNQLPLSYMQSGGIAVGSKAPQLGIWDPQKGYYFIDDDEESRWAPEGQPTPVTSKPLNLDAGYLGGFF